MRGCGCRIVAEEVRGYYRFRFTSALFERQSPGEKIIASNRFQSQHESSGAGGYA
jgi:hypothetical protein